MSQLSSDLPQLPKWPFLCADAVLLSTAVFIGALSSNPTQGWPLITILVCVVLATFVCAIPFLTDYSRSQDQALDERTRSIEALAKTVANSAEQIGIAVQGLGRLDDQLQRHLRQIDQVPQRINERLGDLQQRLANSREGEIEELERELAALKASEGDRLESVVDQIQRATTELARLEQSVARHAADTRAGTQSLEASAKSSATQLASVAEASRTRLDEVSALSASRLEAAVSASSSRLDEAAAHAGARLESAAQASAERLDTQARAAGERLQAIAGDAASRIEGAASQSLARLEELSQRLEARMETISIQVLAQTEKAALQAAQAVELAARAAQAAEDTAQAAASGRFASPAALPEAVLATADEPALPAELAVATPASEPSLTSVVPLPGAAAAEASAPAVAVVPAAVVPETLVPETVVPETVVPETVVPETVVSEAIVSVKPLASEIAGAAPAESSPKASTPAPAPLQRPLPPERGEGRQQQPRKKPEPVPAGMVLDLFNEHFSLEDQHPEPLVSRSVSADGATRIIATAYIGIGNKLFIRGDGPGMSWERGIPLHFVSIGKWRWESLEAESSFRFKLYKNDHQECASLGEQRIDAGQQAELSAHF